MYEIKVSTRRVTQYIIEEAYKWLYQRIISGEYSANRSKDGKSLLLQIEEEQAVTAKTYRRFISLFDNSPFSYMMYRAKRKYSQHITTDLLCNYFVQYNGEVLPLGFVKDFFEDDYETQQEVQALLTEFGKSSKTEIAIAWRRTLLNKENSLDQLQNAFPSMLKPHPVLLLTQAIRLAITVIMTVLLSISLNAIYFWEVMQTFIVKLKFNFSGKIISPTTMDAYAIGENLFREKGELFTMGDYLNHYGLILVVCLIVLFILISRYQKLIQFMVFLGRMIFSNVYLMRRRACIHNFEKTGIEKIGAYYMEIIPGMAKAGVIQDSDCLGVPAEKKMYNTIVSFDEKKLTEKISKWVLKYYSLHLAYESKNLSFAKKQWCKGLVFSILLTIVLIVLMVPSLYSVVLSAIF